MVILFDIFNLPEDIFEIVFSTKFQILVAKLLIDMMKEEGGEITKSQMSLFANRLHEGTLIEHVSSNKYGINVPRNREMNLSYNKRQFYDRILTPMKSMGMIDYDLYKKTYRLSDKFNKAMIKVGLLWLQELRNPVGLRFKSSTPSNS